MPRQRLPVGMHGRIMETTDAGRFIATVYIRDKDGRRRRVERCSTKSPEAARMALQRHLAERRAPISGAVNSRTDLDGLFDIWIAEKASDGLKPQSLDQYRDVWKVHGRNQIGALRASECDTAILDAHLKTMSTHSQSKRLRMILTGMMAIAVRHNVLDVNPAREVKRPAAVKKPTARAVTTQEYHRIRAAIEDYASQQRPGPKRGRLLLAFIDVMVATGARPNEVLALRWEDVDLKAATVTIAGTLVDHGRVEGQALHRQDERKGGAAAHTVRLPQFGVKVLSDLAASGADGVGVFVNRNGGWMSLANMRRGLREALPDDLAWVTPHSFRRTVATVVRNDLGPAAAQQQLSHSKLSTTEAHYLERHTTGPDVRVVLDRFAAVESGD